MSHKLQHQLVLGSEAPDVKRHLNVRTLPQKRFRQLYRRLQFAVEVDVHLACFRKKRGRSRHREIEDGVHDGFVTAQGKVKVLRGLGTRETDRMIAPSGDHGGKRERLLPQRRGVGGCGSRYRRCCGNGDGRVGFTRRNEDGNADQRKRRFQHDDEFEGLNRGIR